MSECACGKHRFGSRRVARLAARKIRGGGGPKMRSYECDGGFWHLTSASARDTEYLRRLRRAS